MMTGINLMQGPLVPGRLVSVLCMHPSKIMVKVQVKPPQEERRCSLETTDKCADFKLLVTSRLSP